MFLSVNIRNMISNRLRIRELMALKMWSRERKFEKFYVSTIMI